MKRYILYAFVFTTMVSCGDKVIDAKLMAAASEVNKTCPVMVDKETRLDNAVAMPGKVFQYRYTLVNYLKTQIDTSVLKQSIEPNMVQSLASMPEMKYFRDNKVTMEYNYRDKTGAYIMKITVKPSEYAK